MSFDHKVEYWQNDVELSGISMLANTVITINTNKCKDMQDTTDLLGPKESTPYNIVSNDYYNYVGHKIKSPIKIL